MVLVNTMSLHREDRVNIARGLAFVKRENVGANTWLEIAFNVVVTF